jgi:hypothetical protein
MSAEFTPEMPDSVGLWEFTCAENNDQPERVAITLLQDWFIVHSEHLGETALEHFHGGLTQLRWRKIA